MKIDYHEGSIFSSTADVLVYGGALYGFCTSPLGGEISERYPDANEFYQWRVKQPDADKRCIMTEVSDHQYIAYLAYTHEDDFCTDCQCSFTREGNYSSMRSSFEKLRSVMEEMELYSIAIPFMMQCGKFHNKFQWASTLGILCDIFKDTDIELEIWRRDYDAK